MGGDEDLLFQKEILATPAVDYDGLEFGTSSLSLLSSIFGGGNEKDNYHCGGGLFPFPRNREQQAARGRDRSRVTETCEIEISQSESGFQEMNNKHNCLAQRQFYFTFISETHDTELTKRNYIALIRTFLEHRVTSSVKREAVIKYPT
jgi:hypothetical protein